MEEILNLIGNSALTINVVALVIYQFTLPKRTAFGLVLFLACALGFFHMLYQAQIEQLYGIKEYAVLVPILWYLGFAFTDLLFVFVSIKLCTKHQLLKDKASNFILLSYLLQAFNQLIRYADRHILETDVLGGLYRVAVPTLNIGVVIIVVVFVFFVTSKKIKESMRERD